MTTGAKWSVVWATESDSIAASRPVDVQDLFRSFCQVLDLSADDEYTTTDERSVKLVEGGNVIPELFT
jgi:hypothetical protein